MIEAIEKNDIQPICPHCKKELVSVYFQRIRTFRGKRNLYFCPHCRAILNVSLI